MDSRNGLLQEMKAFSVHATAALELFWGIQKKNEKAERKK